MYNIRLSLDYIWLRISVLQEMLYIMSHEILPKSCYNSVQVVNLSSMCIFVCVPFGYRWLHILNRARGCQPVADDSVNWSVSRYSRCTHHRHHHINTPMPHRGPLQAMCTHSLVQLLFSGRPSSDRLNGCIVTNQCFSSFVTRNVGSHCTIITSWCVLFITEWPQKVPH